MTLCFVGGSLAGVLAGYALHRPALRRARRQLAEARAESAWRGELLRKRQAEADAAAGSPAGGGAVRLCECRHPRAADDSAVVPLWETEDFGSEDLGA